MANEDLTIYKEFAPRDDLTVAVDNPSAPPGSSFVVCVDKDGKPIKSLPARDGD